VAPEFHPLIFNTKTGEEVPFRSLMPGYEPLPPSRVDNADFWKDKDEDKKWEGDSLYPAVGDERPKTTSAVVSRQNTLERQTSNEPRRQISAGSKNTSKNGGKKQQYEKHSPGSTPKNLHGKGSGGKSQGKGGNQKSSKGQSKGGAVAVAAGPSSDVGFELSPHSRALHNQRYSARAASFGAPPGFGQPRYSRQHGYEGYPLPTAELFDMYTEMGPAYRLPEGGRRASIGAPPGLSRGGGLTPDFTEFVTRLERDIEYDYAMAAISARREAQAHAARSPASWRR
jgi:hypothetical protein